MSIVERTFRRVVLPDPEAPIGKYGHMRQRYLKEHRRGLYSSLILSEKLYPHLLEIDRAARERMDAMLPRMMDALGGADEYAESTGGGNRFSGIDLRISIIYKRGRNLPPQGDKSRPLYHAL